MRPRPKLRLTNERRKLAVLLPVPRSWRISGRTWKRCLDLLGGAIDLDAVIEYGQEPIMWVSLECVRNNHCEVSPKQCDWVAIMPKLEAK